VCTGQEWAQEIWRIYGPCFLTTFSHASRFKRGFCTFVACIGRFFTPQLERAGRKIARGNAVLILIFSLYQSILPAGNSQKVRPESRPELSSAV
jgi:hypothetical protein